MQLSYSMYGAEVAEKRGRGISSGRFHIGRIFPYGIQPLVLPRYDEGMGYWTGT